MPAARFDDPVAGYHDWPGFVTGSPVYAGERSLPGAAELFGVPQPRAVGAVHRHGSSVARGVRHTRLSWDVGFGPQMSAWLCHPDDAEPGGLPGALALHSHGGLKSVGAERMLDVPDLPRWLVQQQWAGEGGRPYATELASRGFTVLAPDAFTWGARRFPLRSVVRPRLRPGHAEYERLAAAHEDVLMRLCVDLGTTYAGMVAHDDLSALSVLRTLCRPGPVGAIGFSGGGGRAAALAALDGHLDAVVVAGMMATLRSLVPGHSWRHSWLLHVPGLSRGVDLPGLAAAHRDHRLMVVYGRRDELFPTAGMEEADALLRQDFATAPGSYTPHWHDGGHEFPVAVQEAAFTFLARALGE